MTSRKATVVVGAGQAGLGTRYHLAKREHPFVILDERRRLGDNWRRQYDSLRLYSRARLDGLPGMAFPASPWTFPTREMAYYLERYASTFELPVRGGTRVGRVSRNGSGYVVDCGECGLEAKTCSE